MIDSHKFRVAGLSVVLFMSLALYSATNHHFGEKPVVKLTSKDAQNVYRKIVISLGQRVDADLIIIKSPDINAFTDGKNVYIYTGMLDILKNESELALIMGHELAHIVLGHTSDGLVTPQTIKEAQADKYGAFLALRAGYDVCQGRYVFSLLKTMFGDDPTSDHPALAYRVDQLDVNCPK